MSFDIPDQMQVSITLPRDEKGMMGRECPECELVFNIKPGTGLKGEELPCHCAYCGHVAPHNQFFTKEQIEYAKSFALRQFTDQLHRQLKRLEFNHPARGPFGIGIGMKVTTRPYPIRYYGERELETEVVCDQCTLLYSIYGAFAFCPDCGSHNSFTILTKNLELADKMLVLAAGQGRDLAEQLIGDALENVVSGFDGFGRELCRVAAPKATNPAEAEDVRFQNLTGARTRVRKLFSIDMTTLVAANEWEFACRCFQKRHLLAHKMGVVDEDYLQATNDRSAVVGRKIQIGPEDVKRLCAAMRKLGEKLVGQLLPPPRQPQRSSPYP
jgi:hypothetical protein